MIYENEELRLKTIGITSEIERGHIYFELNNSPFDNKKIYLLGQSEIKSLKREREQLRREIW